MVSDGLPLPPTFDMSIQTWDTPNPHDNGAFNPTLDPNMAFANTPTSSNFDLSMQNAQMQRMQNGNMRNGNGSPAGFQNPMYQTTSMIPSKRPHDGFTGSPRQASRSHTPQQAPYGPGFTAGAVNGQPPNPYQHLHQNSSNTSPSPIMQNQAFNAPSGIPPRMQTASPSPYSPAGPNFAPQASPVQSDYGSRVDTPSNGGQQFMQGTPYANGMNATTQSFTPPPGNMVPGGFPGGPNMSSFNPAAMTPEQQRQFEMKQQNMMRQLQANNAAAQQRHQMTNVNPMMNSQNSAALQQAQQAAMRQANARSVQQLEQLLRQPDQFAAIVHQFMTQRQLPFSRELIAGGRPIHCAQIFATVIRFGGAKRVTMNNGWPQVAQVLQLHPSAAHEVSTYWHQNLQPYETMYMQRQAQARAQQMQAMQGDGGNISGQMIPGRQPNYNQDAVAAMHARRQSASFQTPPKGPIPGQQDPRQTQINGFSPPHDVNQQNHLMTQQQLLQANQKAARAAQQSEAAVVVEKRKSAQSDRGAPAPAQADKDRQVRADFKQEASDPIEDTFKPRPHYFGLMKPDETATTTTYGGVPLSNNELNSGVLATTPLKRDFPDPFWYGNLDLHALIMSLKSGLPGEVRLALDLLAGLTSPLVSTHHNHQFPLLNQCGDLLESLIDCAEIQLEFLADNAPEVSDSMLISPYDELVRSANADVQAVQDIPEFASLEYELDKAAERLLAVSMLIRNFSYGGIVRGSEADKETIADPLVVKLIATIVRYLGTRNNLLRTNRNTLDFTKDILLYLSNVAQYITFSGKEEALCILQFLLSFAPLPQPSVSESSDLLFPPYEPTKHRYLPSAVQTLAKLLACGDPNRTYLKSIFTNDLASSPSLDLLTRAFGLCIAPLPEYTDEIGPKIKSRASFLAQGLLAADCLISLIPPTDHTLAHAWLASEDNFSHRLLRVIAMVGINVPPNPAANPAMRQRNHGHAMPGDDGFDMISSYGISILRKLAERAKDADHVNGVHVPSSEISKKAVLLQALKATHIDPRFLQQLNIYASMDD